MRQVARVVLPAAIALGAAGHAARADVGVASVVNGAPVGKPTDQAERVLRIGHDVTANEVVTTKADDRLQIVFLDGSTLTVGPLSQITIDRFVYDPERKTGTLAFTAGRGLFRYVGGAISKTSEVTVRTSSATMGIRGGIAVFSVSPTGATTAAMLFGTSLSVTSNGVTVTTTQPGTQIAAAADVAPSAPTVLQQGSLQQFDRAFQGTPQNAAGATIGAAFSGSSLAQANSGIAAATARAAIPATQQSQLATVRTAAAPQSAQGPMAGAGPLQASGPLQGAPVTQAAGPGAQQVAGALQSSGPLDASSPFQASGPLQNAGPLAAARPGQENGPIQTAMALAAPGAAPGPAMPTVATPAAVGTALAQGNPAAVGQLQNLLGSPQGTNGATLASVVTALTNGAPNTSSNGNAANGNAANGNAGNTPGGNANPGPPSIPSVPVVLPPVVYENPGQNKLSQN